MRAAWSAGTDLKAPGAHCNVIFHRSVDAHTADCKAKLYYVSNYHYILLKAPSSIPCTTTTNPLASLFWKGKKIAYCCNLFFFFFSARNV